MKPSTRAVIVAASALVLVVLGVRLVVASHEWFYSDDFYFLGLVRSARWSWGEAFVPTHSRVIAAYRPLGLDAYFRANFALFGWNAFGYYVTGLILQGLTGLGVVAIARRYGVSPYAAGFCGLFVLLAGPSSTGTYEIADHNYICAAVTTTWSLVWFLDYCANGRSLWRWLSSAMLAAAVLCNEVAAALPLVAFAALLMSGTGTWGVRAGRAAVALVPHWLVLLLFLDFRANGVPRQNISSSYDVGISSFYDVDISLDMLSNTLGNLAYVMGGELRLYAVLLLAAAWLGAGIWRHARAPRELVAAPASQLAVVSVVWLGLTLLPFSLLALPAMRFALVLLPAAALLAGVVCDRLLTIAPARWQAPAWLCALGLVPSWQAMHVQLEHSRGAVYRDAHQVIARAYANSEPGCVTVLCNGPGLADASQCALFKEGAFSSALWESVDPNRIIPLEFSEAASASFLERVRNVDDCLRFYLRRDLTLSTELQPPVPPPPSFM